MPPKQDGTGGTHNFQLHPAFWFGMAICDNQSAPVPNPGAVCVPDSDTNIKNNASPNSPDYIGKHAGTAFLELQFYPPGWIASPQVAVDTAYFVAMNIDSLSVNLNTGQNNNNDCLNRVGQEPVNFAILTHNGVPLLPPNPLGLPFGFFNFDLNNILLMRPGDTLQVTIEDTSFGVLTVVQDLTSGDLGFMFANQVTGFGQVDFNPASPVCTVTPHTFHPMYSTATESTRVPWASHSFNIAFGDEIGRFEFCNAFNGDPSSPNFLKCTSPGIQDAKVDADDFPCANPSFLGFPPSFLPITGCVGQDEDFDAISYTKSWPGTGDPSSLVDQVYHPTPIQFTSPLFHPTYILPTTQLLNYDRVAFETDLPAAELSCDVKSGAGCQNPPPGAKFYPIFSITTNTNRQCLWQFGGPNIPGTLNDFGGTSTAEYGDLYPLVFPGVNGPFIVNENYRRAILNPCPVIQP